MRRPLFQTCGRATRQNISGNVVRDKAERSVRIRAERESNPPKVEEID